MINKDTRLFIFDLDGVLYVGDIPLPTMPEFINYLRQNHLVRFITNNSSRTNSQTYTKLNNLGFECELHEVFTSASMAAVYLQESGISNVYVIGNDSFKGEIQNMGTRIIDNKNAEHLVVGMDTNLNYEKFSIALNILLNGGKFIVCNEDRRFPISDKEYAPGCGAIVKALAYSSDRVPGITIGKPSCYIISKICNMTGTTRNKTVVIGDSYYADVAMAIDYGCDSVYLSTYSEKIETEGIIVVRTPEELSQYIKEAI